MSIPLNKQQTLPSIFFRHVQKHAKQSVFADRIDGRWTWITWEKAAFTIASYYKHLQDLGVKPGDTVALMGENSSAWVMADLAIQSLGAVTVPLYTSNTLEQTQYILQHAGIKIAIIGECALEHPFFLSNDLFHVLEKVLFMSPNPSAQSSFEHLNPQLKDHKTLDRLLTTLSNIQPHDLSSIIYTSGTTGTPKGVMLSHLNIFSNATACTHIVPIDHHDCLLSFLPLCHAFERTAGFYNCLLSASKIAFVDDLSRVAQSLIEVNPSLLCSVPRVLEKVQAAILSKLHKLPLGFGKVVTHAIRLNSQDVHAKPSFPQRCLLFLLKKTLFKKIRHKFGTRLRFIVSGGAPLNPDLFLFFKGIGVIILQGYGQTEASPVITTNRLDNPKANTVGRPIDGVEYKILDDTHELCVKGPNIMMGYYKDKKSTQAAFTADGYLKTGDIAQVDKDGHLLITDRIKDIIVSSGGKNIAPSPIENTLKNSVYIENACVIGEQKKYLSVLLVADENALDQWIHRHAKKDLLVLNLKERLQHPDVIAHYQNIINRVNKNLASYQTLKYFTLLEEPFSIENGTLTPTMKLKRKSINSQYKHAINLMYQH